MEKTFSLIMLCGYRTHGKDFFFNKIIGKVDNKFICLYQNKEKLEIFKNLKNFKRVAFADCVKQDLSEINGIDKDKKIYKKIDKNYIISDGADLSPRDIYIEYAKTMKKQDTNYWVKRALNNLNLNYCNTITDWRFIHEYEYISKNFSNILTFRIFNFDKEISSKDVESEHDLDNFSTDFLILPFNQIDSLEKLLSIFPVYAEYKFKYIF